MKSVPVAVDPVRGPRVPADCNADSYFLSGAIVSKNGYDDACVENCDDDERYKQRDDRVDSVHSGQHG